MKKLFMVAIAMLSYLAVVKSSEASISVSWGTSGQQLKADASTYITGNSSSGLGGFVQLIWAGSDGLVGGFDPGFNDGLNTAWDDRVAATSWIGDGVAFGTKDGKFSNADTVTVGASLGSVYYIRFFTSPSSTWAAGTVPAVGYYGNVTTNSVGAFTISQGNIDSGLATFSIDRAQIATVAIVPEPSTFALLGIGLGLVGLRRFRRK